MCGATSEEQIDGCRQGAGTNQEETEMFTTTDSVKAEVDYRRERLSRDFRRPTRSTGTRRHLIHLFGRKA